MDIENSKKNPAFNPATSKPEFDPQTAFSRTLGWLTEADQKKLANTHVGIIGMGGVGGQYAEILARLGVGHFMICDPDSFGIENTNRQNECKTSNYGRNKAEVIEELILDINPTAAVTVVHDRFAMKHVDVFCRSVDLYIDSIDFFETDLRIAIFRRMRELGKPAFTIAPIGMGAASLVFQPDGMSFDDYFGLHRTEDAIERSLMFMVGLAPSFQHRHYIQERDRLDFANRKTPSTPMGVYACAAVGATLVVKLILGRGRVYQAPWSVHYDAYQTQIVKKYVWCGYRNPFQRLKLWIVRKMLSRR